MGFKEEMEEMMDEIRMGNEAGLPPIPLPVGVSTVAGKATKPDPEDSKHRYCMYDGGDETADCTHKNVREIHLLTSTVRECIDCGKELK